MISDADLIRRLNAGRLRIWLEFLRGVTSITEQLETIPSATRVMAHPCATALLDPVAGETWLTVGDACSTFDPLSSMGVLKALKSGRAAAQAVTQYLYGLPDCVKEYADVQRNEFGTYLGLRRRHYSMEQRWSTEAFWTRRAESGPASVPEQLDHHQQKHSHEETQVAPRL
jgi:flavin-dependent dehydrogenase